MKIQADITWENDWGHGNDFFYHFRLFDFSYDRVNLCQNQHHFTIMLLGLGWFITFYGKEDLKCKKRLEKDLWDNEPKKKKRRSK